MKTLFDSLVDVSEIAWLLFGISLMVLTSSGCGPRLNNTSEIALESSDIRSIVIEPTSREQTIKVSAISEGVPIHVHVHLAEDAEAVDQAITLSIESDKVIASSSNSNQIQLEAKIPANKEAAVRLQGAAQGSATVKLTISN